jgi:hypothetical protein
MQQAVVNTKQAAYRASFVQHRLLATFEQRFCFGFECSLEIFRQQSVSPSFANPTHFFPLSSCNKEIMGGSISTPSSVPTRSQCDTGNQPFGSPKPDENAPPALNKPLSFEEKVWNKFKKEPLVPIGCVATAYFLGSGIKSFQNQDPRRAQKMMRLRVGAQFATLFMFMYYIGFDRINFEVAPQYQRARRAQQDQNEE